MIAAKAGEDGEFVGNVVKSYVRLSPEITVKEMMPSLPPEEELEVEELKTTPSAVRPEERRVSGM
jgi:hypothetical protein